MAAAFDQEPDTDAPETPAPDAPEPTDPAALLIEIMSWIDQDDDYSLFAADA